MKEMWPKLPFDMIRRKKYNRCNCGVHGRPHNKPPWSNHWVLKNAIRRMRRYR